MAKRFTDTEKWKKPFLRKLKNEHKILWIYILDECDHAGIWQVDLEVAEIKTGCKFNIDEIIKDFGSRINILQDGEKWFISDFIDFQYGKLNPQNRVHESVIKILNKYNLIDENGNVVVDEIKPLTSPLQGAKDKDKNNNKDIYNNLGTNLEENLSFEKNTIQHHYEKFMLTESTQKNNFCMTKRKTKKEMEILCIGYVMSLLERGETMASYKPDFNYHFFNWLNSFGFDNIKSIDKEQISLQFKKLNMYQDGN